MLDMIWLKPADGCLVYDPSTHPPTRMPEAGMFVAVGNPHFMAHLRFGDVVEAEPPQAHLDELKAMAATPEPERPVEPESTPASMRLFRNNKAAPAPPSGDEHA